MNDGSFKGSFRRTGIFSDTPESVFADLFCANGVYRVVASVGEQAITGGKRKNVLVIDLIRLEWTDCP